MIPFNHYIGRGEYLDDHACPACGEAGPCLCPLDEQVDAALAPLREDDERR